MIENGCTSLPLCVYALACAPAPTYTNAAGSAFFNLFQPQPTNQVRINESLYIINKCIVVAVPKALLVIFYVVRVSFLRGPKTKRQKTIWSLWISSMTNHTRWHRLIFEHQLWTAKSCKQITWIEYNKPTLNLMLQSNYFYTCTFLVCISLYTSNLAPDAYYATKLHCPSWRLCWRAVVVSESAFYA